MEVPQETGAYCFLFDADNPDMSNYAYSYNRSFFNVILNMEDMSVESYILIGDMFYRNLCENISEIEFDSKNKAKKVKYEYDKGLYIALLWDFAESITRTWSTVDIDYFPIYIHKRSVYCIVLSNFPNNQKHLMDDRLQNIDGYIGGIQIDLGNPLHYHMFVENLLCMYNMSGEILYYEKTYGDSLENYPEWADELGFKKIVDSDMDNFDKTEIIPSSDKLSERGKITDIILRKKRIKNHGKIVANELLKSKIDVFHGSFKFVSNNETILEEIVIPREKLVNYVLNLDHPVGRNKAILFKELLGIGAKEWRYLAAQIINGISNGKVHEIRKSEYGIQYHVDIPIVGLNNQHRTVRTAWIIINNDPPRLTSAFIPSKNDQLNDNGERSVILDTNLQGNKRWEELVRLAKKAGEEAANQIIPTPMFLRNYPTPVLEGKLGGAFVILEKTDDEFVNWLKQQDIRTYTSNRQQSFHIYVKTQSVERAEVYAKTFAKVLRLNGIDCRVETYLS